MEMNTSVILWGLLFGSIGFGYWRYGKKQNHTVACYSGIALMIFPYFISDVIALIVVGIVLMFLPRFIQL